MDSSATTENLTVFLEDLRQDVIREAETEGVERLHFEAFTQRMIDTMVEAGVLDDAQPCYHRTRGIEVGGYGFTDEGTTLDLIIAQYRGTAEVWNITRTDLDTMFRRLTSFLQTALDDYHLRLEEASPPFDMALSIASSRRDLIRVRMHLVTDGILRTDYPTEGHAGDLPVSYSIWDLQRLYRYESSGQGHEPIRIDFEEEFGECIPCLSVSGSDERHTSYVAIVPGTVLEGLYSRYGPRLLELNVRSFLQARGKVNKGIRDTIRDEPERFLAYNNGISATAREIELSNSNGTPAIKVLGDLQIVNGGQTTASLHHAVTRDNADISGINVQAKITVVDQADIENMVPLVSRYANSQNRINEADFAANDPFHVKIEELSRTVWASPIDGTQRQSRWFYERARGQYNDAVARQPTRARARDFRRDHPTSQKFTKTDLAKFENTWAQFPHLVSLGAQKNFQEFTLRLPDRGNRQPDQIYFERLVAKAILFRKTEKIVSAQNFGGYRANIVTYTIAYVANATSSRIDLSRIWKEQDLSPELAQAIERACHEVQRSLTSPPDGRNVTEWCKKKECWDRVKKLRIDLGDLERSAAVAGENKESTSQETSVDSEMSGENLALMERVLNVPAETWFTVSAWAKETDNLQPWQRSIAYSLGTLRNRDRTPSLKQARQGVRLLDEAARLGFMDDRNGHLAQT